MNWKLTVGGYGKIERCEIEVAPLTLFVGDNNSGKSYLMSLLWGIKNLGIQALIGKEAAKESDAENRLRVWIREQIGIALKQVRFRFAQTALQLICKRFYRSACIERKTRLCRRFLTVRIW